VSRGQLDAHPLRLANIVDQGNAARYAPNMSDLRVLSADLDDPLHQAAILSLTDAYARDPMGGGAALASEAKARLIAGLRAHPTTQVFLGFIEGKPCGIATCFRGFSTFAARPLLNLHDLAVLDDARGHGLGRKLLEAVLEHARATGCCKVTLETQENNTRAQTLYRSLGFAQGCYVEEAGGTIFMVCDL
jgi:ribosomal protein S18 acetylase RimI-like enzyme